MWVQLPSGRVVHRLEGVVLVAALGLIPVLVIEADVDSPGWRQAASVANWAIWAVFLAEAVFVLAVAPRKLSALRAHWLDVAIVVLTLPAFGSVLAALRLLRLARLLRLLRLAAILGRALQAERALTADATFRSVALVTVLVVVVSGAAQYAVDVGDFPSLWDGIWWAVVTVTTVGYGDITPTTVEGRVIAMAVMLVGIGFLSVLTATIASRFVKTDTGLETREITAALKRVEEELARLRGELESLRNG